MKRVRSDLKDVHPEPPPVQFRHDLEQPPHKVKDRRYRGPGDPSDHVPRSVPRGTNERRGGRERSERKHAGGVPVRRRPHIVAAE